MRITFSLQFKGLRNESEVALQLLGDSLNGFENVIEEAWKTSGIKGDLAVSAKGLSSNSPLIVNIALDLLVDHPFEKIEILMEFLKVVDQQAHQQAVDFFLNTHRTANEYFAKFGFDFWLFCKFFERFIQWSKKSKNHVAIRDENLGELPLRIGKRIYRFHKAKGYSKAMKPFIEGDVSEICLVDRNGDIRERVSTNDFEELLATDEIILPDFQNGDVKELQGKLVSLQSTHGDFMKIEVIGLPRKDRLLICMPDQGHLTEEFREFYKKDIRFIASVLRPSMYQKPRLVVREMAIIQPELF